MEEIVIRVETELKPTEAEEKVEKALANLFGKTPVHAEPMQRGCVLSAELQGLEALVPLRNLLRNDHIRDAARKAFFAGVKDNTVSFCLNKQVAFAGHVSFSEEFAESPLGPIRVVIECEDPKQLIDWLAPKTA